MAPRFGLALLLMLSTAVTAQNAAGTRSDDAAIPKIVKQTQLVYVPVVVEDKHGRPLSGLTKDDFVVEQDGKQQSIAIFEEVSKAKDFADRAPVIAPGLVENFALTDKQARKSVILILDTLNTPFLDQSRAKKSLIEFVRKSLKPDQPMALMVLSSSGLHQIHSITADPKVLVATVERVESHYNRGSKTPDPLAIQSATPISGLGGSSNPITPDPSAEAAELTEYLDAVEEHYFQKEAARTTLKALEQLAGCFAGIPGRKSVIWATTGFPFFFRDPQSMNGIDSDFVENYERTWKLLNQANLAIYPVDIDGLQVASLNSRTGRMSASMGARSRPGMPPNAPAFDLHQQQQSTMMAFAAATGGKAFLNTNDIEGSFAKAAQESDSYYLIAYYLRSGEDHPGWHKLKVHVKEHHGDVRAREGFFVAGEKPSEKDRLKELTVALSAPADYTGIHFGIKIPAGDQSAAKMVSTDSGHPDAASKYLEKIHVSLAPDALYVDSEHDNLVSADFAVIAVKNDKVFGQTLRTVKFNLSAADLEKVAHRGFGFDETVAVPAGEYEIRVVLRDLYNGKIGSVRTNLNVP